MTPLAPVVFRAVAAAAVGSAMLLGSVAIAQADTPANCTAGDLARVSSGVSNATADYLFSHPDVNTFFTGLKGQDPDVLRTNVQNYLDANPQVKSELQSVRQPLVDFKANCQ
ncbi:MAG: heme-binding protein [Mycobacterium sp.]|nr:heme-binding protein [Mycobacterium sp.]